VFSPKIFDLIGQAVAANEKERDSRTPSLRSSLTEMFRPNWTKGSVSLEQDVIMPATDRSDCRPFCVFINPHYWHQIKSAGMSIKCNEEYLAQASELHPELLTPQRHASIIGNVTIHPSAQVDPSAVIGPNVTIGQNVKVGRGVRVHNSIILDGAELQDYCCLRWTIIGWNCVVGVWARIEGIPNFSPDDPADTHPDGITILGRETTVAPGTFIYNSVVMSHKSLTSNCFGRVLL
jgi:mannose-1-phosphate guanylyltransferase